VYTQIRILIPLHFSASSSARMSNCNASVVKYQSTEYSTTKFVRVVSWINVNMITEVDLLCRY
jgi:hypothetical protein